MIGKNFPISNLSSTQFPIVLHTELIAQYRKGTWYSVTHFKYIFIKRMYPSFLHECFCTAVIKLWIKKQILFYYYYILSQLCFFIVRRKKNIFARPCCVHSFLNSFNSFFYILMLLSQKFEFE